MDPYLNKVFRELTHLQRIVQRSGLLNFHVNYHTKTFIVFESIESVYITLENNTYVALVYDVEDNVIFSRKSSFLTPLVKELKERFIIS